MLYLFYSLYVIVISPQVCQLMSIFSQLNFSRHHDTVVRGTQYSYAECTYISASFNVRPFFFSLFFFLATGKEISSWNVCHFRSYARVRLDVAKSCMMRLLKQWICYLGVSISAWHLDKHSVKLRNEHVREGEFKRVVRHGASRSLAGWHQRDGFKQTKKVAF